MGNHQAYQWERNGAIYDKHKAGNSFAAIGREYNLTRERIRQIVNKWESKHVKPGP